MYICGQEEMQSLDRYTMEVLGLPGIVLMENAGFAIVQHIMEQFPNRNTSIVVLAGSGNNGGDGFVIARRLHDYGYNVELCLLVEREKIKGDALVHFNVYCKRDLPLFELKKKSIEELRNKLKQAEVIVDAILGTGTRGPVRDPIRSVIEYVNEIQRFVVSVDIPSGVNANTGVVENIAVKATKTITFVMPKKGFFLQDGPNYIGDWQAVNISVPPTLVDELKMDLPQLITMEKVKNAIPSRPASGHKGTFGHGLIIGGCHFYVGAPLYTAKAAFQTGIGLVTLAVPPTVYEAAAVQCPESIFIPLQGKGGHISPKALSTIDFDRYKALVIGPGIGRFNGGETLVEQVLTLSNIPLIIDADALFYVKDQLSLLQQYRQPIILTPHPGEMAHLLQTSVKEVEANRLDVAKQFATTYGVYVLLKGHRSVIATPSGQLFVNPLGNDALGKGGSGDVLAGVILSFIAQGATPLDAMIASTYLHAKAGEDAGAKRTTYAVTPHDVISTIGTVIKKLL